MRRLLPAALVLGVLSGCGYAFAARPALPGGADRISVPVFENDGSDAEVGTLLGAQLAARAQADDRLASPGAADARLVGRIEAVPVTAEAFPSQVSGAGLYRVGVRVRLRLVPRGGGAPLVDVTVSGNEPFLAGRGPEETEANRRRALARLAERLADEAWARLTAGPSEP